MRKPFPINEVKYSLVSYIMNYYRFSMVSFAFNFKFDAVLFLSTFWYDRELRHKMWSWSCFLLGSLCEQESNLYICRGQLKISYGKRSSL